MKKVNKFAAAALVAGGLLAGVTAAHATTISSAQPDLVLAFIDKSQADLEDLEIDLGTISNLDSLATANGGSVSLSNYLSPSDLVTAFGSGWNTSGGDTGGGSVFWTVFGTNNSTTENWLTSSSAPLNDTSGNQATLSNEMFGIYQDLNGKTSTANSGHAYIVTNDQTDTTSFYTLDGGSGGSAPYSNWGDPNGDVGGNIFKQTTSASAFKLWDETPNVNDGNAATEVGTFSLASNGTMTFTEVGAAIPEPSTWASIVLGAAGLLAFRRRRLA